MLVEPVLTASKPVQIAIRSRQPTVVANGVSTGLRVRLDPSDRHSWLYSRNKRNPLLLDTSNMV